MTRRVESMDLEHMIWTSRADAAHNQILGILAVVITRGWPSADKLPLPAPNSPLWAEWRSCNSVRHVGRLASVSWMGCAWRRRKKTLNRGLDLSVTQGEQEGWV